MTGVLSICRSASSTTVAATDEPDSAAQAAAANRFAANVYIGFEAGLDAGATVHYYAVPQFESAGGRRLAEAIGAQCATEVPSCTPAVAGMRLPVLRETRMPAVLMTLGDVQHALDHAPDLVRAVVTALGLWSGATGSSAGTGPSSTGT